MSVPIIRQLALAYPDVEITMLSRKQTAPLFEDMPVNVRFFGADLKGRHKGIGGLNRLLQDIDYKRFDTVADIHDVLRSKYLRTCLQLSGCRVAYIYKGRLAKRWLCCPQNKHKQPLKPTQERYADVLTKLGFTLQPMPPGNQNATRRGIGIAPFAAHKGKVYPLEKMEVVVRLLSEHGEPIYLFGAGEKERNILEQWAERYPDVHSIAGKLPINEEIDFMRTLRLMLTMDSANMHLASIAGTRVLSIWGATHPAAGFLGYGQSKKDCIQRDLPCRPCSIYGNKACKYGDYRCMDIAPTEIAKRIEQEQ